MSMRSTCVALIGLLAGVLVFAPEGRTQDQGTDDFYKHVQELTSDRSRMAAPTRLQSAAGPAALADQTVPGLDPYRPIPAPACRVPAAPLDPELPRLACTDLGGPEWLTEFGVTRAQTCVGELMQSLDALNTGASLVLLGLNAAAQNPDGTSAGDVIYANPGKLRALAFLAETIASGGWARLSGCSDADLLGRIAGTYDVLGISQDLERPAADLMDQMRRLSNLEDGGDIILTVTELSDLHTLQATVVNFQRSVQMAYQGWQAALGAMTLLSQSAVGAMSDDNEAVLASWDDARGRVTSVTTLADPDGARTCGYSDADEKIRGAQAAIIGHRRLALFKAAYYDLASRCLRDGITPRGWAAGTETRETLQRFSEYRTLYRRQADRAANAMRTMDTACSGLVEALDRTNAQIRIVNNEVSAAHLSVTDRMRTLAARMARGNGDRFAAIPPDCRFTESNYAMGSIRRALDSNACLRQSVVKGNLRKTEAHATAQRRLCEQGEQGFATAGAKQRATALQPASARERRQLERKADRALDDLSGDWESSFGGVYRFRGDTAFFNGFKALELERTAIKERADGSIAFDYVGVWLEDGAPGGDWKGEVFQRDGEWIAEGLYNRYDRPDAWNSWTFVKQD